MRRPRTKVDTLLIDYVANREKYYRFQLQRYLLKDIIQESEIAQDLPILKHLIIKEFPKHKDLLFKYLMLQ